MYSVYFNKVLFPIAPSSLKLTVTNKNKTYDLINGQEINVLNLPGLSKINTGFLLPAQEYSFTRFRESSGYLPPAYYLSKLESWKNSRKPITLTVQRGSGKYLVSSEKPTSLSDWQERREQIYRDKETGRTFYKQIPFKTVMQVSIEDYTINEDAEKYGSDVYVEINLKQYVAQKTKVITFKKKTATVKSDRESSKSVTSYTVKDGDNLWDIARKCLGDGSRNVEIYQLNKTVIESAAKKRGLASSSKGWWIFTGTKLKIPKK